MLCYLCKQNEATVHLAQIADGKMQKLDLCEACAKEKGVQDVTNVSLASLLAGLGLADETPAELTTTQCPVCGFAQSDFKKSGRLGCSVCWETFADALRQLLKAMHKGERHLGKIPRRAAHTIAVNDRLRDLSKDLEQAVRDERYETAAEIRDRIRELESQLRVSGKVT